MQWYQKGSYAVGHVYNDVCASMWFTFLLIFYEQVVGFTEVASANLLLIGQIVDGIATPAVGYLSDRSNGFFCYSKRKSWHLLGTVLVTCSFPLVFHGILFKNTEPGSVAAFMNYVPWICLFQIGWATVQINHLSLIPELADSDEGKNTLNSLRFGFLIASNIFVYIVLGLLLNQSSGENSNLSSDDLGTFQNMALIVCGTGLLFTGIFHIGVREKNTKTQETMSVNNEAFNSEIDTGGAKPVKKRDLTATDWLKRKDLYAIAVAYMCARMVQNCLMVFSPVFTTYTLSSLSKEWIAILPLVQYLAGFPATIGVKFISKYGTKYAYFAGVFITIIGNIWVIFLSDESIWQVILVFVIFGLGANALVCSSLALISEYIGENTGAAGFVFGFMSLCDKVVNGVGVVMIENFGPACSFNNYDNSTMEEVEKCGEIVMDGDGYFKEDYYRDFMSYGIAAIGLVGCLGLVVYGFVEVDSEEFLEARDKKIQAEKVGQENKALE